MSVVALLYQILIGACLMAGLASLLAWRWEARRRVTFVAALGGWFCTLLALVTWGLRWAEAGHLPIFGTYESALSLCVVMLVCAVLWEQLWRFEAGLMPFVLLVAAAIAGHGIGYNPGIFALTISERSWVVDVHAVVAWLAFGLLALNAGLAFKLVLSGEEPRLAGWLQTTLHWGFVAHTGMMVSGSFYKFLLFGKAWSFDPMESMGLVAWVAYGTLLHMQLLGGWKGRRLAKWCLFVFVLLVFTYRGIVFFPGWASYHILDVDLRVHMPR